MSSLKRKQTGDFIELQQAIARQGMTLRGFAKKAGVNKSVLWRLIHGQRQCGDLDLVTKISEATGGDVGLAEFSAYHRRLAQTRQATK